MALASENLSDLVRPGLEEEFEAVRKRIFVPDSGPDKTYCTLEKQQHSANTNSCVCFFRQSRTWYAERRGFGRRSICASQSEGLSFLSHD